MPSSLKRRRPRDFRATPGHPYVDVLDGERRVGRIFRSYSAPQDRALDVDDNRGGGHASRAVTRIRSVAARGQGGVR
jgi:hypothetical protein